MVFILEEDQYYFIMRNKPEIQRQAVNQEEKHLTPRTLTDHLDAAGQPSFLHLLRYIFNINPIERKRKKINTNKLRYFLKEMQSK